MATVEELDGEIDDIRTRIEGLKAQRAQLASVLLSAPHLSTRLQQRPVADEQQRRNVTETIKKQTDRNLENVYRACAGVTAYKVQDPDPNAVDNGNILGVRIEVFVDGSFVETYHVLFNRPSTRHKSMLRIHRHTVPACIPIKQLANKHLPQSSRDAAKTTEQDLVKFGRVLRKELVAWYLRTAAVEKLRKQAGIKGKDKPQRTGAEEASYGKVLNAFMSEDEDEEDDEFEVADKRERPISISDIESDLAGRQLSIIWSNGRTAAIELAKDGEITSCVVRAADGSRESGLERKAIGRIEGLLDRLSD